MPLKLALGVRETVTGHGLGGLDEVPPPLPMHPPGQSPKALLLSWQLVASIEFSPLTRTHQSRCVDPPFLFPHSDGSWHQHMKDPHSNHLHSVFGPPGGGSVLRRGRGGGGRTVLLPVADPSEGPAQEGWIRRRGVPCTRRPRRLVQGLEQPPALSTDAKLGLCLAITRGGGGGRVPLKGGWGPRGGGYWSRRNGGQLLGQPRNTFTARATRCHAALHRGFQALFENL